MYSCIPFIIFALIFSLLVVTQTRCHIAGSSPLPTTVRALHLFFARTWQTSSFWRSCATSCPGQILFQKDGQLLRWPIINTPSGFTFYSYLPRLFFGGGAISLFYGGKQVASGLFITYTDTRRDPISPWLGSTESWGLQLSNDLTRSRKYWVGDETETNTRDGGALLEVDVSQERPGFSQN